MPEFSGRLARRLRAPAACASAAVTILLVCQTASGAPGPTPSAASVATLAGAGPTWSLAAGAVHPSVIGWSCPSGRQVKPAAGLCHPPTGRPATRGDRSSASATDGNANVARFADPEALAVDASGQIDVADAGNNRIRQITTDRKVRNLAGSGAMGFADGNGSSAAFNAPHGIAAAPNGTLYIADTGNNRIRMLSANGVVSTLAGSGQPGLADGHGTTAQFNSPLGVAVDRAGNVFVADSGNRRIRKIAPDGAVTTPAGPTNLVRPFGLAVEPAGNVDVADSGSGQVIRVSPDGRASPLPGSMGSPSGVATDASGNVYVADWSKNTLRMIGTGNAVSPLAGTESAGFADGAAAAARFAHPIGLAIDQAGNLYVADQGNSRVRVLSGAIVGPVPGATPSPTTTGSSH